MSGDSRTSPVFEESYRPLVAAVVGAGVLAMGVLSFTGEAWAAMPPPAQELLAVAARTAFVMFNLLAGLAAISFLVRSRTGPTVVALVNLFAAGLFIGGVFVCGLVLSRALAYGRPSDPPPDAVAILLGGGVLGAAALALILIGGWFVTAAAERLKAKPDNPPPAEQVPTEQADG